MKTHLINSQELAALCEHTTPLSVKHDGRMLVLKNVDGEYIKFFYPRTSFFSSNLISPFYKRFIKNAEKLHAKHIATISVRDVFYCPEKKCHIVVYAGIPGETLHSLLSQGKVSFDRFIDELVRLHQTGVYFRDLHLKNILLQPSGECGLIDIADCHVFKNPLGLYRRGRNIAAILRVQEDAAFYQSYGIQKFIATYCQTAALSSFATLLLRGAISISQILRACRLR